MEKKEIKAKKINNKELLAISKAADSNFKYTDHLVNDPLTIGGFSLGNTQINSSGIKRIDTIIASPWETYKKKVKPKPLKWPTSALGSKAKLKINPSFIPHHVGVPDEYVLPGSDTEELAFMTMDDLQHTLSIKLELLNKIQYSIDHFNSMNTTGQFNVMIDSEKNNHAKVSKRVDNIRAEINNRSQPTEVLSVDYDSGFMLDSDDIVFMEPMHNEMKHYIDKAVSETPPDEIQKISYFEKLTRSVLMFYQSFSAYPAVIKGYIINDEVITNNDRLVEVLSDSKYIYWDQIKTIIRVSNIIDSKIVSKITLVKAYKFTNISKLDRVLPILPVLVKFKIVDYKNSNNFFAPSKIRTYLKDLDSRDINWQLESTSIVRSKTKHSTYLVLVEHPETKDTIKFVISDCKFTNMSLSGYNVPADKTININSIVRIKDNKLCKYGIRATDNAEVLEIRPNLSSKKISKDSNNRRMDIVLIKLNTGKKISVYAQDLKFIENKKQQDVNANIKKETKSYQDDLKKFQEIFAAQQTYQWGINTTYTSTQDSF